MPRHKPSFLQLLARTVLDARRAPGLRDFTSISTRDQLKALKVSLQRRLFAIKDLLFIFNAYTVQNRLVFSKHE